MKTKIIIVALFGILFSTQCILSQTTTNSSGDTVSTSTPATSPEVVATNVPPEPAVASQAETNVPTAEIAPAAVATSIQLQDVPITTAIESLARQAGINYLLDPKIGYGQPDKNGQIKAEPTLSIRWEHITYQQALLALLDNYDLQLVQDKNTGIARITQKDPAAPPPLITRVVQLKYAGTSNMVQAVQSAFIDKRSKVLPDTRTSQLVLVATQPEQDAVDMLVNQLDKPTRQVLIETKLVEVSSNPKTKKGVDWTGTLAGQNFSFGNGILQSSSSSTTYDTSGKTVTATRPPFGGHPGGTATFQVPSQTTTLTVQPQGSASNPGGFSLNTATGLLPEMAFLNADGVHAVLSFLNSSSDAQVMSTPRVVTLDNEMATISVTRGFPVINVTASTAGVSSGSSQISYTNVGTTLYVTPRISANDYIYLKVTPDVSSFFGTVSKTIAGATYEADEFDSRRIDTQVLVPNGNTLVIGGLVKDSPQANYTKVPILGDIPVLGYAFRSEDKSLDKDNLLIFITPTIVKDSDFKPTTSDFLDSQPNQMKSPMNPHTWWDSSQPRGDWSNPSPAPGEFDHPEKL